MHDFYGPNPGEGFAATSKLCKQADVPWPNGLLWFLPYFPPVRSMEQRE